jgi:plasmid stability protein
MPVNLSIKNVPERIVRPLRARAKRNHRSLQGELMAILDEAARVRDEPKMTIEELYEDVIASGFRSPSESTQIVREMRDGRSGR